MWRCRFGRCVRREYIQGQGRLPLKPWMPLTLRGLICDAAAPGRAGIVGGLGCRICRLWPISGRNLPGESRISAGCELLRLHHFRMVYLHCAFACKALAETCCQKN